MVVYKLLNCACLAKKTFVGQGKSTINISETGFSTSWQLSAGEIGDKVENC